MFSYYSKKIILKCISQMCNGFTQNTYYTATAQSVEIYTRQGVNFCRYTDYLIFNNDGIPFILSNKMMQNLFRMVFKCEIS